MKQHPKAHKESTRKTLRTKGLLDPGTLKTRRKLVAMPQVQGFKDFHSASNILRVLFRKDESFFPEFAFNVRHDQRIEKSLVDAGFTGEGKGKWVLRTNKFNVFVYM
jgi:hypothetical protein